jgi:hypothetical protein
MREIEFKVWDKKYNIFDDDLWIDCDGTIWDRPARGYDTPHTEIEPLNQDNYIICFYTGICDKNGKKIFERCGIKAYHPNEPRFFEGIVEYDSEMACFVMSRKGYSSIPLFEFDEIEIISEYIGTLEQ